MTHMSQELGFGYGCFLRQQALTLCFADTSCQILSPQNIAVTTDSRCQ